MLENIVGLSIKHSLLRCEIFGCEFLFLAVVLSLLMLTCYMVFSQMFLEQNLRQGFWLIWFVLGIPFRKGLVENTVVGTF